MKPRDSHCWHKRYGTPIHRFTWHCEWYEAKGELQIALHKFYNRLKAIILHLWRVLMRF